MWVSGSADWPAAERQLIISRLGANRRPVRWASWQMPSLGNRRGKSYAGIQSATYRPGTYVSGRLRWASAPRWPATRRWEALACFQATPVAGWLPGGWQHQHAYHASEQLNDRWSVARNVFDRGSYLRKTPTGGPVPWLLVRDEEPARLTPSGRDSA